MVTDTCRMRARRASTAFVAATLGLGLLPSSIVRAEAPAAVLEEITVTALRRSEQLQDTSATIAAFTERTIELAALDSVDDLAVQLPNVSFVNTQNAGTAFLNIRGVGQFRNSEPPVAFIVDGVQATSPNVITKELYDIERIEVLKGPQGALYGRNATGGAINIVTRAPSDELEGRVRVGLGNGEDRSAQVSLSGPLMRDRAAFRLSASHRDFGGVRTNATLGTETDFLEETGVRARLILTPHDSFSADLRYSHDVTDGGCCDFIPIPSGDANDFGLDIVADVLGRGKRTIDDFALRLDWELPAGRLTSTSAYLDLDETFFEDLEWTPVPILTGLQTLGVRTLSSELRFSSRDDRPVRYSIGGYYLSTDRDLETIVGLPSVPLSFPIGVTTDDNQAWALFGTLDYDFSDAWRLSTGLRYDRDDREQTDILASGAVVTARFDDWQPRVSLSYRGMEHFLLYGTYAEGFRSGGFNQTSTFGREFRAETVTSYEIGFKSTLLDGVATLNAALFFNDFEDRQDFVLDVVGGGAQAIVNVPSAEVYGLELELVAAPVPGTRVGLSVGLMDSKITSEIAAFDPVGLGLPADFRFTGNKVPLMYEWSYSLFGEMEFKASEAFTLSGRLELTGNGGLEWEVNNLDSQNPVYLVNGSLMADYGKFALQLWVKNLLDEAYFEEYVSREFSGFATDVAFPGTPRRYGVTATYRF